MQLKDNNNSVLFFVLYYYYISDDDCTKLFQLKVCFFKLLCVYVEGSRFLNTKLLFIKIHVCFNVTENFYFHTFSFVNLSIISSRFSWEAIILSIDIVGKELRWCCDTLLLWYAFNNLSFEKLHSAVAVVRDNIKNIKHVETTSEKLFESARWIKINSVTSLIEIYFF